MSWVLSVLPESSTWRSPRQGREAMQAPILQASSNVRIRTEFVILSRPDSEEASVGSLSNPVGLLGQHVPTQAERVHFGAREALGRLLRGVNDRLVLVKASVQDHTNSGPAFEGGN